MERIWLAIAEDYDGYDIEAIFTTKEDAENYLLKQDNDEIVLREYSVEDEYSEQLSVKAKSDIKDTVVFNGVAYNTTGLIKLINRRWHYELCNGDDYLYILKR